MNSFTATTGADAASSRFAGNPQRALLACKLWQRMQSQGLEWAGKDGPPNDMDMALAMAGSTSAFQQQQPMMEEVLTSKRKRGGGATSSSSAPRDKKMMKGRVMMDDGRLPSPYAAVDSGFTPGSHPYLKNDGEYAKAFPEAKGDGMELQQQLLVQEQVPPMAAPLTAPQEQQEGAGGGSTAANDAGLLFLDLDDKFFQSWDEEGDGGW